MNGTPVRDNSRSVDGILPDFRGGLAEEGFRRRMKRVLVLIAILPALFSSMSLAAERSAVTGKVANIRYGPGTRYEIFFQAEMYYPIEILEKSGNWFKVKDFEGDVGWIHKSLVGKVPSVITTEPVCNIRSGPGMNYKIRFITERGVPFQVLERKGNWIHVRHSEGYEGWIHKSLVW